MRLGRSRFAKIVVFLTNLSTIVAINLNPKGFEPPPKLTASIRCVDGRTILLTITNHNNSLPVNIIKWNSILEDFPVTRVPFTVRTIQEARDLDRAPSAHVTYVDVLDSHFIQIGPLNPYTHEIHVPSWYAIPATGKYRVRWNGSLRGFLGDFGGKPASHDNLRLKRSDIYTLPRMPVFIEADVFLDRSIMPLQVQETRECKGWGLVEKPVENARNGAIDLAKATEINVARNRKFWKRYFNGNDAIGNDVSRVFGNIENYFTPRGGNGFTLVERCAPNERPPCGPGAASYTVIEEKTKIRTTIVFCAGFHEDEKATPPIVPIVQPIRPCEFPGPGPIFDPDMMDQTGIYLNAFLRSGISGEDIFDGFYNTCFGHFCANNAAFLRDQSRFEGTGRPTKPIPDCAGLPNCNLWGEPLPRLGSGVPEKIAANFELYAYSMRALDCDENKIRYCSKEACENFGNSVATYIQNNLQTLILGVLTPTVVACIPILFADQHKHD